MRLNLVVLFLPLILNLQSCSPVQGYPGPARPDTEISIIETKTFEGVTLSQESISGVDIGYSGITVLPGNQEFSGRAGIEEPPYNCRPYTEFNSYGFNECEKDRWKKNKYNDCDCFDYLSVHENCDQVVKEGACRASFKTKAGERYEIAVGMYMGAPVVKVREVSTLKEIGSGKCSKDGHSVVNISRYVGQGRSVAQSAGFYSCHGY